MRSVDNVSLSRAGVANFDNVSLSRANFDNAVLSAGVANFDRDSVSGDESGLTILTPKRELDTDDCFVVSSPSSVPIYLARNSASSSDAPKPGALEITDVRTVASMSANRIPLVREDSLTLHPIMVFPHNDGALPYRTEPTPGVPPERATKLLSSDRDRLVMASLPRSRSVPLTVTQESHGDRAIKNASSGQTSPQPRELGIVERTPDAYVRAHPQVNGDRSSPVHRASSPLSPVMVIARNTDAHHCIIPTVLQGGPTKLSQHNDAQCLVDASSVSVPVIHESHDDRAINDASPKSIDRTSDVSTQAAVNGHNNSPIHPSFSASLLHNTHSSTDITPVEGSTKPSPSSRDRQQQVERDHLAMERERLAIDRKRLAIEEELVEVKRQRLEVEKRKVGLAEELLRQGRHRRTSHALNSLLGGLLK